MSLLYLNKFQLYVVIEVKGLAGTGPLCCLHREVTFGARCLNEVLASACKEGVLAPITVFSLVVGGTSGLVVVSFRERQASRLRATM